jgi:hypothetical protein
MDVTIGECGDGLQGVASSICQYNGYHDDGDAKCPKE